jgi:hypothetical protein
VITYRVLKSIELEQYEKQQLCTLFETIFNQQRTLNELENQFVSNHKGYVYISLMMDENDNIVGSMSVVPLLYHYFNEELTFGRGIDAMILKEHRGNLLNLKKMSDLLEQILIEDGVPFVFSAPNEQNYTIRKRISKWSDIYNLDIYALPLRISKIKKQFKLLDPFVKIYIKIVNLLVINKCSDTHSQFAIHKSVPKKFLSDRYDDSYKKIICDKARIVYKIQRFQDIETAFILDVWPLDKKNMEYAVKTITSIENEIDLIVYFGFLKFRPINLYRVPQSLKPKNTYVSGKILLPNVIDERIFKIENWSFNLSDLDWI